MRQGHFQFYVNSVHSPRRHGGTENVHRAEWRFTSLLSVTSGLEWRMCTTAGYESGVHVEEA